MSLVVLCYWEVHTFPTKFVVIPICGNSTKKYTHIFIYNGVAEVFLPFEALFTHNRS